MFISHLHKHVHLGEPSLGSSQFRLSLRLEKLRKICFLQPHQNEQQRLSISLVNTAPSATLRLFLASPLLSR